MILYDGSSVDAVIYYAIEGETLVGLLKIASLMSSDPFRSKAPAPSISISSCRKAKSTNAISTRPITLPLMAKLGRTPSQLSATLSEN